MRIAQITTPFGKELEFLELQGTEAISELFEYQLTLTSKNPNLEPQGIIGDTSTIQLQTKDDVNRYLNGLVTDFGYLHEDPEEQEYHLYTCTLRPLFWYLTQKYDSRVFVDKTVLEITKTILDEMGIPHQIKCQNSYRKYGHSTQYQETSFNYLSRLFEQEGMYYYFEHTDGSHTLIIVDNKGQHKPILGSSIIPYHSAFKDTGTPYQAYIDSWKQIGRLRTKKVSINDHNYNTAKSKLNAKGVTHEFNSSDTEHYEFYSNFKDAAEASHYQQMRSENYQTQSKRSIATGNVLTIAPGSTFTLTRHPHNVANVEHLIVSAEYDIKQAGYTSGNRKSSYRINFTSIPSSYQYRHPINTPKPRILGTQAAIITGPAGEEVYTNEYGAVKLQYHWDRYGPSNELSSDWVRVIQSSAGASFGSINTPRIGEEVLVDFINGDSDRPIIVGRLYNSANPPPWGFPASAKKSGIRSKSFNSPPENFNELMFNDTAGTELVNFQAQKDLTSLVKNNETRTVNNDRTTTIDNDEKVTVHGFRTENVDKDENITIGQNRQEMVSMNETITIGLNRTEAVGANETVVIGANRTETIASNETINIAGNRNESVRKNETVNIGKDRVANVGKNFTESIKEKKQLSIGKDYLINVDKKMASIIKEDKTTKVDKKFQVTVADEYKLVVGKSSITLKKDGTIDIKGVKINLNSSGEQKHIAKGNMIIKGKKIKEN